MFASSMPSILNFYPRPPRGGRRPPFFKFGGQRLFLSTPSARRATTASVEDTVEALEFLSTPSARRATPVPPERTRIQRISIHALREEGDGELLHSAGRHVISIHALREEGDHRNRAGR